MQTSKRDTYKHTVGTYMNRMYTCIVRKSERDAYALYGDKYKEKGIAMHYGDKREIHIHTLWGHT